MKKRLLFLITTIALIIAQQDIPAFAGENDYTQVLFPIEDQWSEGVIPFREAQESKGKLDYFYSELYWGQITSSDYSTLNGFSPDLLGIFPEIDLSDEALEDEPVLKAPPGGGDPISGVPLSDGLILLLIFSALFISYKLSKNIHTMKTSSLRAKREIFSVISLLFLLLLCTPNLQAQNLIPRARTINQFVSNPASETTIDVLKRSELGVCNEQSIVIQLLGTTVGNKKSTVQKGTVFVNSHNQVVYTPPRADFVGQDKFEYRLICGKNESNVASVFVNVNGQPDNIEWDACFLSPRPIEWGIVESHTNETNHSPYQSPMVGDIDGDGIVEIVVASNPNQDKVDEIDRTAPTITVYKGNDLSKPHSVFNTKYIYTWSELTKYALVRTTVEGHGEIGLIVVCEADAYLRAYDVDGNFIWESDEASRLNVASTPIIADLNNDGVPEILHNGSVFDSSSGKRIAFSADDASSVIIVADILGTGELSCITHNRVLEIVTDENNKITGFKRKLTIPNPVITSADPDYSGDDITIKNTGFILVVDIDNDGELDLIRGQRNTTDYFQVLSIVSLTTGEIKATKYIPNVWFSGYPFAGDIDGDGNVEIILNKVEKSYTNPALLAFKYNSENPDKLLELFWTLPHSDRSGSTGITLFDFDKDGKAELVYRDETHLRIIDGSVNPPVDRASFPNLSDTGKEYPVIADVDNDGQAEILIVGGHGNIAGSSKFNGPLWVYKSSDTEASAWAWARPVWNQFLYNPVYINDDLTAEICPISPAAAFADYSGNIHRPYNNFLQQATLLDDQGLMFRYGPDLTYDQSEGIDGVIYTSDDTDLTATIYILNQGDATFIKPLQVSLYATDGWEFTKITSLSYDIAIDKGATEVIAMAIPLAILTALGVDNPYSNLQIRLNEQDETIPYGDIECLYYNNYYPAKPYSETFGVGCEGDKVSLEMYPKGDTYTYKWYEEPEDGTPIHEGDSYIETKDALAVQHLYVEVYRNDNLINTDSRRAVTIYSFPKELVWTGAAKDQDWHNPENWYEEADIAPDEYQIPRKCTNVLIPDGLSYYPDLSKTTYTTYSEAQCADIRFEFGGEVARTDLLNYDRAFVQYNFGYYEDGKDDIVVKQGFVTKQGENSYTPSYMKRDQYYALSAPLNKIVTGDFNVGGKPNTWQQAFVATQGEGDWVGNFQAPANTNDIELNEDLGYAIALWVAKNNEGEMGEDRDLDDGYQSCLDALEGIIEIPYFENEEISKLHRLHEYDEDAGVSYFYYYYYQQPNFPIAPKTPGNITRADEAYRFIFDKKVTDGKFIISVPAGSEIMIGNPSMSTMNFDGFYAANTDKMENHYRFFENETFATYTPSGSPAKTAPIAPMQAFFIKTKGTGSVDLVYPFATASVTRATNASHGLRSATDGGSRIESGMTEAESGMTMQINASQADYTSHITLALGNDERKNIEQLFYRYAENTPQLYLKDEAGKRNAVQFEGKGEKEIPLGIQFEKAAEVTLSFDNIEDLPLESLTLVDTKTKTETNLLKTNSYTFTHDADGDRFVLRVGRLRNTTGIDELDAEAALSVYPEGKRIVVSSNQAIAAIEVYDTQGRLIIQQTTTDGLFINDSGIYIVRVTLANGERKAVKVTM